MLGWPWLAVSHPQRCSITPPPQLDSGRENMTKDSWVKPCEPCKPNTICHAKSTGGKRGTGKKERIEKIEKKNKKTTQELHHIWGGQGPFIWPSALSGGGWGPEEDEQLKLLYANIGSLVFLQSTPPGCCIPLCMAEAWKGGRESSVTCIERVQWWVVMPQSKYTPQCSPQTCAPVSHNTELTGVHHSSPSHLWAHLGFLP